MPPIFPSVNSTNQRSVMPNARDGTMTAGAGSFGAWSGAVNEDTSVGRAMSGFGDALQKVAQVRLADINQRAEYDKTGDMASFTASEQQRLLAASREVENTNAYDFTQKFMATHDAAVKERLDAIQDPTDKAKWAAKYASVRGTFATQALRTEFQTRDKYQQTDLTSKFDELQSSIDASPANKETFLKQGENLIDASNLPPGQKESLKDIWRQKATTAQVQANIRSDPNGVAADLGGNSTYFRRLQGAESGGNANAKNPNSSASGLYQFTDDTWASVVNSPEGKAAGLTIAGKNDAQQQNVGVRILTQQNAKVLEAAGFVPTEKNLYMAHFLGSGRAVSLLTAMKRDPSANAAELFPDAAAANQTIFYKPGANTERGPGGARSVSEVFNALTGRFDGSKVAAIGQNGGAYSDLSYAQRLEMRSRAEQAVTAQLQQQQSAANEAYNSQYNNLQTQIMDGKVGREAVDAARQPGQFLYGADADHIQKLYSIADKQAEAANALSGYLSRTAPGTSTTWNPFDSNDKAQVEAGVKAMGGTPQAAMQVFQQTGILAEAGSVALRGALASTDPQRVGAAAAIASNMMSMKPNAFAGMPNGKDLQEAAIEWDRQVNQLGRTADEASKLLAERNMPEYQSKVRVRDDQTKAFKDELAKSDPSSAIAGAFKTSVIPFMGTPGLGFDQGQRSAIRSDYADLATEHFEKFGDKDAAKNYAVKELQRLYGVSNGNLMKFPPERVYPSSGDPSNPHGYIYEQAAASVKAATGKDVKPEDVALLPIPGRATAEAWRNGQQAPYQLLYRERNPDGSLRELQTFYANGSVRGWAPDPAAAQKAVTEKRAMDFEAARAAQVKRNTITPNDLAGD